MKCELYFTNFNLEHVINLWSLELNSPKIATGQVTAKSQDSATEPCNQHPSVEIGISKLDVKKYMIALEKELEKVVMSNPSRNGMYNMGEL